MDTTKTTALSALVSLTLIGSATLLYDVSQYRTSTAYKIETKIDDLVASEGTVAPEAEVVINTVLHLYKRRAGGDEPAVAEWLQAEQAVDNLRSVQDTPMLQKLDRMLEINDATPSMIEAELNRMQ